MSHAALHRSAGGICGSDSGARRQQAAIKTCLMCQPQQAPAPPRTGPPSLLGPLPGQWLSTGHCPLGAQNKAPSPQRQATLQVACPSQVSKPLSGHALCSVTHATILRHPWEGGGTLHLLGEDCPLQPAPSMKVGWHCTLQGAGWGRLPSLSGSWDRAPVVEAPRVPSAHTNGV